MQRVIMLSLTPEQNKAVQDYLSKNGKKLATLIRELLIEKIGG